MSIPRSATPWRSSTIASNLRSCPTFAIDASSNSGFSSASASNTSEHVLDRPVVPGSEQVRLAAGGRVSGTYRACRGRSENASPAMPDRIAAGASGSTRKPNRPAVLSSEANCRSSSTRADDGVVLADGLGVRRVFRDERPKPETREQLEAPLARRAAVAQVLGMEFDRHVRPDPRQLTALDAHHRRAPAAPRGTACS